MPPSEGPIGRSFHASLSGWVISQRLQNARLAAGCGAFQHAGDIETGRGSFAWIIVTRRNRLQFVDQTVLFVRVSHYVLPKAANRAVLTPRDPVLLMQVALPDELLVEGLGRRWHL